MTYKTSGRRYRLIGSTGPRRRSRKSKECEKLELLLAKPDLIAGFFPVYLPDGGNGVEVWRLKGATVWLHVKAEVFLEHLAGAYLLNLKGLKALIRDQLDISYYVPLPLSPEVVLISVKTRETAIKGDGMNGYVNVCALEDYSLVKEKSKIEPKESGESKGCGLPLKDDRLFPCFMQQKTVNQRVHRANLAMWLVHQPEMVAEH